MKWTFTQVEGPSADRKTLELDGWNAPFGRPRRDPVIKEIIKSRIQTTQYPGSNKQTRHAFGTNWESTELKGRWMSKVLLAQGKIANDLATEWTEFVKDERTCLIAWGFIVSYKGYIEELELARESENEIAWRMMVQIDAREDASNIVSSPKPPAVDNIVNINKSFASLGDLQTPVENSLNPDFLDSLDNLAAELNKPSALMNKLAGRFSDIEKATFGTLQHFRGAVTGFRTALVTMRDTIVDVGINSALAIRTAESDIAWVKYQASFDTQSTILLDQLNKLDRKAELAQQNEATKFILAKEGDTWESISIRATGGPDKANDVRKLNGARYGEKPVPGTSYLVM